MLRSGAYGVLMRSPVRRALGRWPRLRSFQITLGRRYRAAGKRRSYLSARCPLPPRFSIGILPLRPMIGRGGAAFSEAVRKPPHRP